VSAKCDPCLHTLWRYHWIYCVQHKCTRPQHTIKRRTPTLLLLPTHGTDIPWTAA